MHGVLGLAQHAQVLGRPRRGDVVAGAEVEGRVGEPAAGELERGARAPGDQLAGRGVDRAALRVVIIPS